MNDINGSTGGNESDSVFTDSEIPNDKLVNGIDLKSLSYEESVGDFDNGCGVSAASPSPNLRKKGIKYSKSMVENIVTWLGVDNSYKDVDKWKEHIRRRRAHSKLIGQYKEDLADKIFGSLFAIETPATPMLTTYKSPTIIDPFSKHSGIALNTQISKISTSSLSRKILRVKNPVRIGTKESLFKLAYSGFKNIVTPSSLKDRPAWPHHRSFTMLQIKNEASHGALSTSNDDGIDDVFFKDCKTISPINSCKLDARSDCQAKGQFVGMSKIPPSYISKVRKGRQVGIGVASFLTEAEYRKSRLDSKIKEQMDGFEDHRPYFTCWVTFVQVVCYIFAILAYDLAPFGISASQLSLDVLMPNLVVEPSSYLEESNVWLGLRQADLIHMGAKYAGCMRRDEKIRRYIELDRMSEKRTSCCIRLDGSGCYQTSEDNCSYPFGRNSRKSTLTAWKSWSNGTGPFGRSSGSVCHQDPRFCLKPPTSLEQQSWPDDITEWPLCLESYSQNNLPSEDSNHMTCDITGHPCCIGIKGQCLITTREDCTFKRGYYHQEAFLCSQVSCLEEVCGMIPFYDLNVPNQFYRLFISLFIHAGVVHLMVTIVFQMTVMRDLEKLAGSLRISIIYIFSGVAGSLTSAIFLPYVVEAGPSGSQFGLLSCLFVEVIQNRYILKQPFTAIMKLSAILVFLFLLGLMPMIDNFAHLGGFIFGFLLSFALLPYITINLTDKRIKMRLVLFCLVMTFLLFFILIVIFYIAPIYDCSFCHYINCLPLTPTFCKNMKLTTELV